MQYAQRLLERPTHRGDCKPWALEGQLLRREDIAEISSLSMHVALCHTLGLRLAILYDAPLAEQEDLVAAGSALAVSMAGTVYGVEWSFLAAIVAIRTGDMQTYTEAVADLERQTRCT
jgi:hypothetical protein